MIAQVALAAVLELLGPAREISHSSSASRDTAVLAIVPRPHRILSAGGDFAVASLALAEWSFRLGGFGMLELESSGEGTKLLPFPGGDIRFWRGLYGFSLAVSADGLARDALGARGALELAINARHESEHYTGSNEGGPGTSFADVPHIGDFVMLDVAARIPVGRLDVIARVQDKLFVGQRAYSQGPGADLILRWRRFARVHPFSSTFAEVLFGARGFPDAYLVRNLTGVILPSRHGDLYLFLSGEVGHRKGLAVYTEEAGLGFGLRFAFY
jgi:hypothetical protein